VRRRFWPLRVDLELAFGRSVVGSLDHLVGAQQDRRGHGQAEGPSGFQVDDHFELRWQLEGQVGWFGTFENLAHEGRPARPSSSASTCTRTSHTSRRTATASSSADRSARPTAPTTSAPRCCSSCRTGPRRTSSGTRSRLPRMADIRAILASSAGCSATDWCRIDGSRARYAFENR
jgi:hypothetical protein